MLFLVLVACSPVSTLYAVFVYSYLLVGDVCCGLILSSYLFVCHFICISVLLYRLFFSLLVLATSSSSLQRCLCRVCLSVCALPAVRVLVHYSKLSSLISLLPTLCAWYFLTFVPFLFPSHLVSMFLAFCLTAPIYFLALSYLSSSILFSFFLLCVCVRLCVYVCVCL